MEPKKYSIDRAAKQITLHVPMTKTELCRLLIADGHGDLVESIKCVPDDSTKALLRDGGFIDGMD